MTCNIWTHRNLWTFQSFNIQKFVDFWMRSIMQSIGHDYATDNFGKNIYICVCVCLCVCMCVCVCVCVWSVPLYIYIYIYIYVCVCVCVNLSVLSVCQCFCQCVYVSRKIYLFEQDRVVKWNIYRTWLFLQNNTI